MSVSRHFFVRLPRAAMLLATLAALSLSSVPSVQGDVFTVGFTKNGNLNVPSLFNGDAPATVTTAVPGVSFSLAPTSPGGGNNAWQSDLAAATVSAPATLNITGLSIGSVQTVYALINSVWGFAGQTATVTFNATGGVSQSFTLTAGKEFRDFNNDGFTNTVAPSVAGVANTQVFGTGPGGAPNGLPLHRLDMITFTLSSAFVGQNLTSITLTDNGSGITPTPPGGVPGNASRVFLAGLVVSNAVPEPGPIALAAVAGLAGLVGYGRRYRGVVRGWLGRDAKVAVEG